MPKEIVVMQVGSDWCVRCPGALFERMACEGDALRVAHAHATAAERSGEALPVRIRTPRRPYR